ncbi:MAG: aminoacyl-tRNA hydrolase [Armatimonadota bacterium]
MHPRIIFGLGNPGKKYSRTRHNLGFLALEQLADKYSIKIAKKSLKSIWGEGEILSKRIVLVMPLTFMNLSGTAVKFNLGRFGIKPTESLIVCDDLNLSPGSIRIRMKGSAGGHNGLKSIIDVLQTDNFPRLRIGIGQPPEGDDSADFVLEKFSRSEWKFYQEEINKTVDILESIIENGIEYAMNKYN